MGTLADGVAHAKLTRRLHLTGRREDGYHLLEAEMLSIDLTDELAFSEGDRLEVLDEIDWRGEARLETAPVPSDASNLVAKALALTGGPASVRLTKRIPPGGGLGGGSADAAAVLRWRDELDPALAAKLGADVPFCLLGGRAEVAGIGEVLEPLAFEAITVVLVTPGFPVSTIAAYRAYDELERSGGIAPGLQNDLEPAALAVEPRLGALRDLLGGVAGERPVLAGSGSSYFFECTPSRAEQLAGDLAAALGGYEVPALVSVARSTPSLCG
jgi:4-diphosphocytidyl-2-C-methyl-D-erythritol kinase